MRRQHRQSGAVCRPRIEKLPLRQSRCAAAKLVVKGGQLDSMLDIDATPSGIADGPELGGVVLSFLQRAAISPSMGAGV